MLQIAAWIVWSVSITVAGLIGLLHCALSVPKAIAGTDDGPSPIPLIGELVTVIALVAVPKTPRWPLLITFAVIVLWFADYTCRLVAALRSRRRK